MVDIREVPAIEAAALRMRAEHGPYRCDRCRNDYHVVVRCDDGEYRRLAPPRFCPMCGAETPQWAALAAERRLRQ